MNSATTARLGLLLVAVGCAIPMMLGLGEPEMQSDEAIYSYAVERILDTGDWLTPRSIPTDEPFLEKPPLKLWLTAASVRVGIAARDDGGLRLVDAFFGAVSFIYIFLIGRRLGGPSCGVAAAIILFSFNRLLFIHGLRTNNMDAAMVLSYAGGLFHFARWVEGDGRADTRGHAAAVAAYFTLGFMAKFVAAAFLPMVALVALLWRKQVTETPRQRWREWLLPAAAVLVVSAPWFVYQTWQHGTQFWRVILGAHVVQRFTASLDPTHLQPWHFYFSDTWTQLAEVGARVVVVVGGARLVFLAWRGEWIARLIVLWAVLPVLLISSGTSKLIHYAYPFWPPLGLAGGLAVSWAMGTIRARLAWSEATQKRTRWILATVVTLLMSVALWTAMVGPVYVGLGGYTLFTSNSVARPAIAAGVLLGLTTGARSVPQLIAMVLVCLMLPLRAYEDRIGQLGQIDHPLRQMRDCMTRVRASGTPAGDGAVLAYGGVVAHAYYYYLRHTGPWVITPAFDAAEVLRRLTPNGHETPVVLTRPNAAAIRSSLPPGTGAVGLADNLVGVFSGAYASCAPEIIAAGGLDVWGPAGSDGR